MELWVCLLWIQQIKEQKDIDGDDEQKRIKKDI